jgi:hypothetical protein
VAFVFVGTIVFLFPSTEWTLDATRMTGKNNWRYGLALFVSGFAAVLASEKWTISGWRAWIRTALLAAGALGIGIWFLATLWHNLAVCPSAWAAVGFALLLGLLWFLGTRF